MGMDGMRHAEAGPESSEARGRSEWKDETGERGGAIAAFLERHFSAGYDSASRYDPLVELHLSGTNRDVFDAIVSGDAMPVEARTFYESGKPSQIHAVFAGGRTGHNIDVYLKGRALDDFLKEGRDGNGDDRTGE